MAFKIKYLLIIISLALISGCDFFYQEPADQKLISGDSEMMENPVNDSMQKDSPIAQALNPKIEYKDWTKEEFDKAILENKVVFLEFWASWCPICQAMDPKLRTAFSELDSDQNVSRDIIGFKVDYDNNPEMNRKYGISSQHTHIVIDRDGNVAKRALSSFSKDEIKMFILEVANG